MTGPTNATTSPPAAALAAAQRVLPRFDRAGAALTLINLSENATFRVESPGSPATILRLHRAGYHSLPEIESELDWVDALRRDAGLITPQVIETAEGERVASVSEARAGAAGSYAVLFHEIAGREPAEADLVSAFDVLGSTTAQMHAHAMSWRPPARFTRMRWDLDTTLGRWPHWGRWTDGPGVDRAAAAVLTQGRDVVVERLTRLGQGPDHFGLVHADLRLANLLVTTEQVAVIDFDDCGWGWFMYDLATALSFLEDSPMADELIGCWLNGYKSVRSLSQVDEREIPTFVLLRRLMLLAWLGSHSDTDLARSVNDGFADVTADLTAAYLRLDIH